MIPLTRSRLFTFPRRILTHHAVRKNSSNSSNTKTYPSTAPSASAAAAANPRTPPITTPNNEVLTQPQTHLPNNKNGEYVPNVSKTNETALSSEGSMDAALQESVEKAEELRTMQAPNRRGIWSRSQRPRAEAMMGPRFEQTIMEDQPRPLAAIDLIHKQPVRWTSNRTVTCDGGGGPLGHPRIYINVDKPQICWCTYCGLPFAHEHHRHHLESQPSTSFPLEPTGDPAQVNEAQRVSDEPFGQR